MISIIRFKIIHLAFLTILLFLYASLPNAAEILEGRVVGVHDGDTVTLLMSGNQQVKIRLAQIDAPESDQAFGQRSKESLSGMVFNKNIRVEKETTDKYGRTVGTIFVDSLDANREQVKRGMAWVYRKYMHDQSLVQIESDARRAKIGLWSDPNPVSPWEYRHGAKNSNIVNQPILKETPEKSILTTHSKLTCGGKRYCKEMSSCEEAKFYLTQCGLSRLDGDGDGSPCETICNN